MRVSGVWGALLTLSMLLGGAANASTDPVAADPNTGTNFNRYAYGNNNPYRFVDPDGRQSRDFESISRQAGTYLQTPVGGTGPNLITWGAAEVLCGFCDLNYTAPSGSGALQPVAAPWEVFVPLRGALGAGARSADTAADVAAGFRGSKGFELSNAPYQPVRNAAGIANGRLYSGHAFDQMQNRGIVPSVVDNAISNGVTFPTKAGTTGYFDAVNGIRVITNSDTGRVITVIPGAL